PLTRFRRNIRQSGLRQINAALAEVNAELLNLDLSLVDRAVLAGRQRELRAARKLVQWLLATPHFSPADSDPVDTGTAVPGPPPRVAHPHPRDLIAMGRISSTSGTAIGTAIETTTETELVHTRSLQSMLFDAVLAKLETNLENVTETPMEIDILRQEKKRELFFWCCAS
ncbi:MAG: hypothetical protein HC772_07730, partial [Leptolyngbyaceae cyanobacterium CRU_2_3]|nr:hypothetical protein [Leptolyngbyaceae cyanobacterium CRU_2_3]